MNNKEIQCFIDKTWRDVYEKSDSSHDDYYYIIYNDRMYCGRKI